MAKDNSGQAILEGVFATGTMMLFTVCTLTVAYLCFARMWIEYQLDRAVVCVATTDDSQRCMRKLQTQADALLPFGKWGAMGAAAGRTLFVVNGHFQLGEEVNWKWQKSLDIEKMATKKLARADRLRGS